MRSSVEGKRSVYRVQGFTCAGCAATFERNVQELPQVQDAKVNFGAAKLTVFGEATVAELEKAGAFEGLTIVPETDRRAFVREPLWRRKGALRGFASAALLLAGYWAGSTAPPLFALCILVGGYPLFMKGIRRAAKLELNMNALMTIAIVGAAAIGQWAEGATVVVLFAISEALESYSMDKARQSIRSLIDAAPREATIRRDGRELQVPARDIEIGDVMIVKPGQAIALDGRVLQGRSTVNQAAITGESMPVARTAGDEVFAGTLNEEGRLEIEVTKRAEDTTLAKIVHLVEEAQAVKAPSQAFVDRFARYYTPGIVLAALLVAVAPPLIAGHFADWLYRALTLLVVGCPCALVISTPVAIVTAIGSAARNGVLIKGGIHLEQTGKLAAIAFDKTGTLTKGVPVVTDVERFGSGFAAADERELLGIAAAIETSSQHPLAAAIVRKARAAGIDAAGIRAEHFESLTGKGARAVVRGVLYYIGSPRLFAELLPLDREIAGRIAALQNEGKTVLLLGTSREVLALFAAADEARSESLALIRKLHTLGIKRTVMLTGDNRATAEAIAGQLGIDEARAELMPQQKLEAIRELQRANGSVAMIGDGVNDAPALAAATVGIAMGGAGTDAALETASIVLMGDDLAKLPFAMKLSRRALAIIKQNIAFSLFIKAAAVMLIIPGWLTLWMAVIADMGATLIVTLNALRLLRLGKET